MWHIIKDLFTCAQIVSATLFRWSIENDEENKRVQLEVESREARGQQ